jgi:hypothetical protein
VRGRENRPRLRLEAVQSLEAELKKRESDLNFAEPRLRACVENTIKTDPATHTFLRQLGESARTYAKAKVFLDRMGLLHPEPEKMHELIGEVNVDPHPCEQPWKVWQLALHTNPDATFAPAE